MPRTTIPVHAGPGVQMYLAGDMRITCWPGAARVEVPSASEPGTHRTVTIDGDTARCDCPGFARWHHGTCRHITAVKALIKLAP